MQSIEITVVNGLINFEPVQELTAELVNKFRVHTTISSLRRASAIKRIEVIPGSVVAWAKELPAKLRFESNTPLTHEVTVETVTDEETGEEVETEVIIETFKCTLHVLSSDVNKYLLAKSIGGAVEDTEVPEGTEENPEEGEE